MTRPLWMDFPTDVLEVILADVREAKKNGGRLLLIDNEIDGKIAAELDSRKAST